MRHLTIDRNTSKPIKASFWYTICNIVNKCIQFITIPIFTRLLSTKEYGQYSLFVSWQMILSIIATLNIHADIFNNGILKYKNSRSRFISASQGLTTTTSVVLLMLFVCFSKKIQTFIKLPYFIIVLLFVEIMIQQGYELWATNERFDYKYRWIVLVTITICILNPLVGIIFVKNANEKGYARVLSILLIQIVIYAFFYFYNYLQGKAFYIKEYWKYLLTLSIPLVPHYLSQILLNQMDRIMITNIIDESKAGIYSVAYSAGMMVYIIGQAIQRSFTPWLYRELKETKTDKIKCVSNSIVLLMFIQNLVLVCLAPEIILVLGGKKYLEAIFVIPPIACSSFLIFLYSVFCVVEFYFEETRAMMIVSVIGALINYLTNLVCISKFGYLAAGYTTLFSYIYFVLVHYFIMNKALKKNSINRIFDIKFFVILSSSFVLICIGMLFIYKYVLPRYVILLIIGMVAFFKRKQIMSIFDKRMS